MHPNYFIVCYCYCYLKYLALKIGQLKQPQRLRDALTQTVNQPLNNYSGTAEAT